MGGVRHEVMSEAHFKIKHFLLGVVYEILPQTVAGWLCLMIEGRGVSANRLFPFYPWEWLYDLVGPQSQTSYES